jgi:hypothetical protein
LLSVLFRRGSYRIFQELRRGTQYSPVAFEMEQILCFGERTSAHGADFRQLRCQLPGHGACQPFCHAKECWGGVL